MISSKLIRSSVIASFAVCLSFACERSDQQDGGAADDTTGTTPATGTPERQGSAPIDTTSTRDTMQGTTGTERSPGTGSTAETEEIERTGGQDLPMGAGGTQSSSLGTGGHGGYGGHAGKGGKGGAATR